MTCTRYTLAMSVTQLTTAARITSRVGTLGCDLRLDDADTDTAADLISDVIDDASTEAWGYLQLQYSATELQASKWVELRVRDIAVGLLCERRLNDMPGPAKRAYDRAIEMLQLVQLGSFQIPDARPKRGLAPQAFNLREQLRPLPHAVVSRPRSPQGAGPTEGIIERRDQSEDFLDFSI